MRKKFYEEPSQDFLADTLNAGIADGTFAPTEEDFFEDDPYLEEGKYGLVLFYCCAYLLVDESLGVTSTPFLRKTAKKKPEPEVAKKVKEEVVVIDESMELYEIHVGVLDGVGVRTITMSSSDELYVVLGKVATCMKLPHLAVEMGYEAPWSAKNGQKKIASYLTNDKDLEEFWCSYDKFVKAPGRKPKQDGILIRNMSENAPVCCTVALLLSLTSFTPLEFKRSRKIQGGSREQGIVGSKQIARPTELCKQEKCRCGRSHRQGHVVLAAR